jgi:hypothetical protein
MQSIMIMIESNDITSSKQALLSLHGTDPEYCTQNARFVLEGLLTVPHLHETQFLHADPLVCQESRNLLYIDASQQRQQLLRLQVSTTHFSTVLPWRNMGVHRLGRRGVGPANRNSIGRRFGMGSSDIHAAAPLAVKCCHGFSLVFSFPGDRKAYSLRCVLSTVEGERAALHFPWKRIPVWMQKVACGSTGPRRLGGATSKKLPRGLGIRDKQVLVVNKAICDSLEAKGEKPKTRISPSSYLLPSQQIIIVHIHCAYIEQINPEGVEPVLSRDHR